MTRKQRQAILEYSRTALQMAIENVNDSHSMIDFLDECLRGIGEVAKDIAESPNNEELH